MLWLHSIGSSVDWLRLLRLLLLGNLLGLRRLRNRHANLLLGLRLLINGRICANSTLNDLVCCTCVELCGWLAYGRLSLDTLLISTLLLLWLLTNRTRLLLICTARIGYAGERLTLHLWRWLLELRLARRCSCLRLLHGLGGVLGRGRHL